MYRVVFDPDNANPSQLPWCVRGTGPVRWFRSEVYAEIYCVMLNLGHSDFDAMRCVQMAPNDLERADEFLEMIKDGRFTL